MTCLAARTWLCGGAMPRISEFYGIIIAMYYRDHAPPHFHARYGGDEVLVSVDSLTPIAGALPARALALVVQWASAHQDELRADWSKAQRGEPLDPIDPLH
jgi:hypothetical protein